MKQETITLAELRQTELYKNVREKLMKQEPVAWINILNDASRFIDFCEYKTAEKSIPLYTEPQYRELSDEEILQFQDKVPYTLGSDLIDFARAILRKAQEK